MSQDLTHLKKQQLQVATELARKRTREWGYRYFINEVFSASFGGQFVGGKYVDDIADHLQDYPYTMDITGRDHMKSTRLYVDIMYELFIDNGKGWEAHYLSYSKDLAAYQLSKLKEEFIERNPFFAGLIDNKKTAESVLSYNWPGGRKMKVTPHGLTGSVRGIHSKIIYVDDSFKTEDIENNNDITPVQIRKINNIVLGDLLPMVKKAGKMRIVGTSMTPSDFYFNPNMQKKFKTWITPAIIDETNKIVLWPEWKSYEELVEIRETMSIDKFNREYMAMPVTTSNSYLDKDKLLPLMTEENMTFEMHKELQLQTVIAGFDIGKKRHPSHLSIFVRRTVGEDGRGRMLYAYRQVYSFWMDKWDYGDQVDYCNQACEYFNIGRLAFDNTDRVFEWAIEQKKLDPAMEPIVLNHNNSSSMAAYLGTLVDRGRIRFVNDTRQFNLLLSMGKDLKAPETPGPEGGHADSFESAMMGVYENSKPAPKIYSLYDNKPESDDQDDDSKQEDYFDDGWALRVPGS